MIYFNFSSQVIIIYNFHLFKNTFPLTRDQFPNNFTNNEVGGEIYSCVDDDIGEKVGYFDDNGIAHFNKKK